MDMLKEPEVDIYVDPRPRSQADEQAISDYIRADKQRHDRKKRQKKAKTAEPASDKLSGLSNR